MENVSNKRCEENQNTHFKPNNLFLENRDTYEIMWKNILEPGRPDDDIAHAHCMLGI